MVSSQSSQCALCVHHKETKGSGYIPCCKAFPADIPKDLLFNRATHTEPYAGDGGIMFERDPRWERVSDGTFTDVAFRVKPDGNLEDV